MINNMMKNSSWFNTDMGLLVLRIGMGIIFIFAGYMKASTIGDTVGFFAKIGFSAFWAYLVTAVELLGGVALLLGIWTRGFSLLLTIVMIVAIYINHSNMTAVMTPFAVFFATLALTLSGGGKYSIKD